LEYAKLGELTNKSDVSDLDVIVYDIIQVFSLKIYEFILQLIHHVLACLWEVLVTNCNESSVKRNDGQVGGIVPGSVEKYPG
jgi:hypothetical protein